MNDSNVESDGFTVRLALGKNLQSARIAAGLTQTSLAEQSTISRTTIAQIENGEGDPCLSTISLLAHVLKVSPMLLLMKENEFRGLVELIQSNHIPAKMLTEEQTHRIKKMLSAGISKQKTEAIKQISTAATLSGLSVAGAAIGSVLVPGIGGIIGATLGLWLNGRNTAQQIVDSGVNAINILVCGNMGVGKSTFIKNMCRLDSVISTKCSVSIIEPKPYLCKIRDQRKPLALFDSRGICNRNDIIELEDEITNFSKAHLGGGIQCACLCISDNHSQIVGDLFLMLVKHIKVYIIYRKDKTLNDEYLRQLFPNASGFCANEQISQFNELANDIIPK